MRKQRHLWLKEETKYESYLKPRNRFWIKLIYFLVDCFHNLSLFCCYSFLIYQSTGVPFGLVISPMAKVAKDEIEPPMTDFGPAGPVRCIRCKAYMCSLMQFIDGGRYLLDFHEKR